MTSSGRLAVLPRLLGVRLDEVDDAVDERVLEPLLDRARRARRGRARRVVALPPDGLGDLDQPLGRVGPAVEDHVLDPLEQVRRDVLVDASWPALTMPMSSPAWMAW